MSRLISATQLSLRRVRRQPRNAALSTTLIVAPHPLVAHAAEFVAGHRAVRQAVEARREARDIARHQHEIDVGPVDQKAMHDVGAGGAERDRRIGGHDDALRREGILLADRAHGHRAVRPRGAAEVALDELAGQMQRAWDRRSRRGACGMRRLMHAGEGRHATTSTTMITIDNVAQRRSIALGGDRFAAIVRLGVSGASWQRAPRQEDQQVEGEPERDDDRRSRCRPPQSRRGRPR